LAVNGGEMLDEPAPGRQGECQLEAQAAMQGGTVSLDQRLADVASDSFTSVPGSATAGEAAARAGGTEWVVVTGTGRDPVGLLRRTELERADERQRVEEFVERPVIVLPGHLSVGDSLATWACHEFEGAFTELDGIIAVADDDRPVGVFAGSPLLAYAVTTRGGSSVDTGLGGIIDNLGRIIRTCRFTDLALVRKCPYRRSFSVRPVVMPGCKNPDHLAAHRFGW
jgi:hypothetical protein